MPPPQQQQQQQQNRRIAARRNNQEPEAKAELGKCAMESGIRFQCLPVGNGDAASSGS